MDAQDFRSLQEAYLEVYQEIDEATRMRKELGKEGEIATRKELAARSKAYKRSGSVDRTIAAAERGAEETPPYKRRETEDEYKKRTLKRKRNLRNLAAQRRKSVRGDKAGLRGYAANVQGSDRDLQFARGSARSAGTLTPAEKKKLGEEYDVFDVILEYLVAEGYADTNDNALVIMANMSEEWKQSIVEQSAIASRTAAVVDDQRRGSHGMAHDQKMTGDSIKKLNRYKGPRVTPGLPGA